MNSIFTCDNQKWTFEGPDYRFIIDEPHIGGFRCSFDHSIVVESVPAVLGEYPESLALPKMRRPHATEDGAQVSFQTESYLPFGTPATIVKKYELTETSLDTHVQFRLPHSFPLRNIAAGGLRISGAICSVEIAEVPENKRKIQFGEPVKLENIANGTEVFHDGKPPVSVRITDLEGQKFLFELGRDIWRWTNAKQIGDGVATFIIRKEDDALCFTWSLYSFRQTGEDHEPPFGRNWSFTWSLLKEVKHDTVSADIVIDLSKEFPEGNCACSKTVENYLKKRIRQIVVTAKQGDIIVLKTPQSFLCKNAAHVDRANKVELEHWDLPILREFELWANHKLNQTGARLLLVVSDEKEN